MIERGLPAGMVLVGGSGCSPNRRNRQCEGREAAGRAACAPAAVGFVVNRFFAVPQDIADGRLISVEVPFEGKTRAPPPPVGRRPSGTSAICIFRAHLHGHPQYSMAGQTREAQAQTRNAASASAMYRRVGKSGASLKGARADVAYAAVGITAENGHSTWGWAFSTSLVMRDVICIHSGISRETRDGPTTAHNNCTRTL